MLAHSYAPTHNTPPATLQIVRNLHEIRSGWFWQEHETINILAGNFTGKSLMAARSVYVALTEIASHQRNPGQAIATCAEIGERAGCGELTARRYLKKFNDLGIIKHTAETNAPNAYKLLAQGITSDTPTAQNRQEGITQEPPRVSPVIPRGITGDTPTTLQSPSASPLTTPLITEESLNKDNIITNSLNDEKTEETVQEQPAPLTIRQSHAWKSARAQIINEKPNLRSKINATVLASITPTTWQFHCYCGYNPLVESWHKRLGDLLSVELGHQVAVEIQ